jgi:hypothetical protein
MGASALAAPSNKRHAKEAAASGEGFHMARWPVSTALLFLSALLLAALTGLGCASSASTTSSPLDQTTQQSTLSSSSSPRYTIDAGDADAIDLSATWLKIAKAASFDAGNVHAAGLTLDFTPSGSLLRLLIACPTSAGQVTVSWDGNGGSSNQRVNLAVSVARGSASAADSLDDSHVDSVLAAIDSVGAGNMIAKLLTGSASMFYRVKMARDLGTVNGDIQPGVAAYQWLSHSFQALAPEDALRKVNTKYVRLVVVALQPMPALGSPTTAVSSFGLAYFVIPMPGPGISS